MEKVNYCETEQMDLSKALQIRKKYEACTDNFDKCDGTCVKCPHNYNTAEYHRAERYVWGMIEEAVQFIKVKGESAYDANILQSEASV